MTQTEALMAIANRNGGLITPALVLAKAKDPKSVLHGAFTWDDTEAAKKWRIHEAQVLIRRCRITVETSDEPVYAFIGVSTDRTDDSANNPYRLASDVAKAPDLMAVAEADAVRQLKGVKDRYSHIRKLNTVWTAIDSLS